MTWLVQDLELTTTSGSIAVANLNARIDAISAWTGRARSPRTGRTRALLVDLLLLRGQVLGRISDYERATEVAEALVREAPDDATAWLARARTRAVFHRFSAALDDVDAAVRRGADRIALEPERAAICQAAGYHDEALARCRGAAERRCDFAALSALAVLLAERGEVAEAERLFAQAQRCYRDVSPFPVAELDVRRGLMWLAERELPAARAWFDAAVRRVPAYAPALGHLAAVEAAEGAHDAAIARLRPLAESSDDPVHAATLAAVLDVSRRHAEAEHWRAAAAARYDELAARHPDAFAEHATGVRLSVSGDPRSALVASEAKHGHRSPGGAGGRTVHGEPHRARGLTPAMEERPR